MIRNDLKLTMDNAKYSDGDADALIPQYYITWTWEIIQISGRIIMSDATFASTSNSDVESCSLLFWPLRVKQSGFVVGWRLHEVSPIDVRSQWNSDGYIVAGVVEFALPNSVTSPSHFEDELSRLHQKMHMLQTKACYCCTGMCQTHLSSHSLCSGCTTTICLKSLEIIAFFNADHDTLPFDTMLPIIDVSSGIPWFKSNATIPNSNVCRQLVYYSDSYLYHHDRASPDSYFHKILLHRIVHSKSVIEALNDMTMTDDIAAQNIRPRPRELPYNKACSIRDGTLLDFSFLWHHITKGARNNGNKSTPPSACEKCGQHFQIASRYQDVEQHAFILNLRVRRYMDTLMGILVSGFIVYYASSIGDAVGTGISYHFARLRTYLQWLEHFPVGFKLNVCLTEKMGHEIRNMFTQYEGLLLYFIQLPYLRHFASMLYCCVGVCFGISGILALTIDLVRMLPLHITLLSWFYGSVFKTELYLIRSLWRLSRGKKRNIVRNRTDTMHYDSMQLLLGTILFAVTLFLFTTILIYHATFACIHAMVVCSWLLLVNVYAWVQSLQLGTFILYVRHRESFVVQVYFHLLMRESNRTDMEVLEMHGKSKSLVQTFGACTSIPCMRFIQQCFATLRHCLAGHLYNRSCSDIYQSMKCKEIQ
jgi:hypothetical protein